METRGPSEQRDHGSSTSHSDTRMKRIGSWFSSKGDTFFLWPAVVVLIFFAIFPLIVSLYLSFSRVKFVRGGVDITWVGLANYHKLFLGTEQKHFLGVTSDLSWIGWLIMAAVAGLLIWGLVNYLRSPGRSVIGFLLRLFLALFLGTLIWLSVSTLLGDGRPGTLVVTLVYVFFGLIFQYGIGLGLALLAAQQLPGRRFFRVVFLLPMMITPVGVAYTFRMIADTGKGPLAPIWQAVGLGDFSWVTYPWGARAAVMIGDIWQWTPFMFIVLLAAIEGQPHEPVEAALVDGANRRKIFRHITFPLIIPVSTALILIRMIEAFKIIDLPNVLTNGGPGTATESLTLQSFFVWRTLDIGGSAAIAYILLILVTILSISFVNLVRRRTSEVA